MHSTITMNKRSPAYFEIDCVFKHVLRILVAQRCFIYSNALDCISISDYSVAKMLLEIILASFHCFRYTCLCFYYSDTQRYDDRQDRLHY